MGAVVKFGAFELDLSARELRNRGLRLRVRDQSIEILAMLVGRPGEVITREEIRERLWPEGTFVEFEHSVNSAVNRLRGALGDSPTNPRFIETLPRRGYRFLASVETVGPSPPHPERSLQAASPQAEAARPVALLRRPRLAISAAAVVSLTAVVAAVWTLASRSPAAPPPIRSIAVLPLVNLSHDSDQEYFADGMTEALTSDLGQIGKLRVISRTSAMTYKGSGKHLKTIARELNVDALVEGSVLRDGSRVRIVAQLINTAHDTHIWTGTYERELQDVLRLQSEVAQAIAREVRVALTTKEATRMAAQPAIKPEAYEAYLKGMFHLNKFTPEGFERGIAYLLRAVEKDPSDSMAYAALAIGYGMMGHDRFPDAFSRAKAAARKSLDLGGPLAEAHVALAMHALYWDWDIESAGREFRRALELKPNFAEARRHYSWYLRLLGRRAEGIEEMKRAQDLEPLVPQFSADLAAQHLEDGQLDAALTEARKALELNPDFCQGLAISGAVHFEKRMYEEALASHRKAAAMDGAWKWPLGRTYAQMGRKADALAIAAEMRRNPGPMEQWGLAVIYASLGQKDEAFRWLEAAYRSHFSSLPWIRVPAASGHDLFAALRNDPRFDDLTRRIGPPTSDSR
jgi:TolB-like protein/DNA-binding winged helix-turn-helix (wHTH) protein